ncbi:MAG: hypothetical protein HYX93_00865 [Chloroflexi bacterium]|nr:hypothetical protein [Chloroflexota bacterium]
MVVIAFLTLGLLLFLAYFLWRAVATVPDRVRQWDYNRHQQSQQAGSEAISQIATHSKEFGVVFHYSSNQLFSVCTWGVPPKDVWEIAKENPSQGWKLLLISGAFENSVNKLEDMKIIPDQLLPPAIIPLVQSSREAWAEWKYRAKEHDDRGEALEAKLKSAEYYKKEIALWDEKERALWKEHHEKEKGLWKEYRYGVKPLNKKASAKVKLLEDALVSHMEEMKALHERICTDCPEGR